MWVKILWHCFSEDVNKHPLTLDRQPLTNQSQLSLTSKVHCGEPMSSFGSGNDSRQLYHQKPRPAWKAGKAGSGVHGTTYSQFDRFIRLPSYSCLLTVSFR